MSSDRAVSPRSRGASWRSPWRLGGGFTLATLALALALLHRAGRNERLAEARLERPVSAPARVLAKTAGGPAVIRLTTAEAAAAGLATQTLEPTAQAEQAPLFGVVIDPVDLAQVQSALREAAPPEPPAAAVNPAPPATDDDAPSAEQPPPPDPAQRLARQTRQLKREIALRRFGARLTGWMEAGAPELDAFSKGRAALLRLTLLPGWPAPRPPERAWVEGLGGRWVEVSLVGAARVSDGLTINLVLFYRAAHDSGPAAFLPGFSVYGWGPLGDPATGVLAPTAAVVWCGEKPCVYVRQDGQGDGERFVRREISMARPTAGGWFEERALRPGEQVVTVGAQVLLSEELRPEPRTLD